MLVGFIYRYRYRKVCSTYDSVYMREEFCTDTDIGRLAQHMTVYA